MKNSLVTICAAKAAARDAQSGVKILDIAQYQIAFSRMGLNFIGVKENTGDVRFDKRCMRDDKKFLGDQRQWDTIFDKSSANEVTGSANDDRGALHGVITVAASSEYLYR